MAVVKVFRSLCEQLLLFGELDGFLSRAQSYLRYSAEKVSTYISFLKLLIFYL